MEPLAQQLQVVVDFLVQPVPVDLLVQLHQRAADLRAEINFEKMDPAEIFAIAKAKKISSM